MLALGLHPGSVEPPVLGVDTSQVIPPVTPRGSRDWDAAGSGGFFPGTGEGDFSSWFPRLKLHVSEYLAFLACFSLTNASAVYMKIITAGWSRSVDSRQAGTRSEGPIVRAHHHVSLSARWLRQRRIAVV